LSHHLKFNPTSCPSGNRIASRETANINSFPLTASETFAMRSHTRGYMFICRSVLQNSKDMITGSGAAGNPNGEDDTLLGGAAGNGSGMYVAIGSEFPPTLHFVANPSERFGRGGIINQVV
jgi:hypothetical protein